MLNTSKDKKYTTKKQPRKNIAFAVITAILLVLSLFLVLEMFGVTDFYQKPKPDTSSPTEKTINYNPPTEDEATAGDIQKDEISKNETSDQPDSQPAEQATVVIVDANQYSDEVEVRAFISNIVKDGTCKFTFTKDGATSVEKTTLAYADASTTPCIALTIPKSDFPISGNWEVTVTYSSDNATGSATKSLGIQL